LIKYYLFGNYITNIETDYVIILFIGVAKY